MVCHNNIIPMLVGDIWEDFAAFESKISLWIYEAAHEIRLYALIISAAFPTTMDCYEGNGISKNNRVANRSIIQ